MQRYQKSDKNSNVQNEQQPRPQLLTLYLQETVNSFPLSESRQFPLQSLTEQQNQLPQSCTSTPSHQLQSLESHLFSSTEQQNQTLNYYMSNPSYDSGLQFPIEEQNQLINSCTSTPSHQLQSHESRLFSSNIQQNQNLIHHVSNPSHQLHTYHSDIPQFPIEEQHQIINACTSKPTHQLQSRDYNLLSSTEQQNQYLNSTISDPSHQQQIYDHCMRFSVEQKNQHLNLYDSNRSYQPQSNDSLQSSTKHQDQHLNLCISNPSPQLKPYDSRQHSLNERLYTHLNSCILNPSQHLSNPSHHQQSQPISYNDYQQNCNIQKNLVLQSTVLSFTPKHVNESVACSSNQIFFQQPVASSFTQIPDLQSVASSSKQIPDLQSVASSSKQIPDLQSVASSSKQIPDRLSIASSSKPISNRQSLASSNKLSSADLILKDKVKQRRQELGLSQPGLAKEINEIDKMNYCTCDHISHFERGVWSNGLRMKLIPLLEMWIEINKGRKRQPIPDDSELIEKVKQRRNELRLTQRDLAEGINEMSKMSKMNTYKCLYTHISLFERGLWTEGLRMELEPLLQRWVENNKGRK